MPRFFTARTPLPLVLAGFLLTPAIANAMLVHSTLDLDASYLTMEIKLDGVSEGVIPLQLIGGEPKFDVTQPGTSSPTLIAPLMGFNSGYSKSAQLNTSQGLLTVDSLEFELGGLLTPDVDNPGVLKLDANLPMSFLMRGDQAIQLNGVPLFNGEGVAYGVSGPGDTGSWSEVPIVEGIYNLTIGVPITATLEIKLAPETPLLEVIVTGFLTYQGVLPVPEPSSAALAGIGAVGLVVAAARRCTT